MADREAAQRLKRVLRVAMSEKGIDGWEELGLSAGVSPTTIENWIYARTVPQAKQIRMVADFLRPYTSAAALEAAYEGVEPPEPLSQFFTVGDSKIPPTSLPKPAA